MARPLTTSGKVYRIEDAVADIADHSTVLVGGFGDVGTPEELLTALAERAPTGLTVVSNNAGGTTGGLARLLDAGAVTKVQCSYPRQKTSTRFSALHAEGRVELDVIPQGTLAERIRCAAAGLGGFYTRTSAGTHLGAGKETRRIGEHLYVFEEPLAADVALVKAWRADTRGNLVYRRSARNFNPVMAAAAALTIAQVHDVVPAGDLDPESIVTPGIFVDRIVRVDGVGGG